MPRYYAGNDLSDFTIRVNYLAANGVSGTYSVETPTVTSDNITFEWLTGRGVFLGDGDVTFNVCLRKIVITDGVAEVVKEYNTTIARGSVLAGLEVEESEDPTAYSILAKMETLESSAQTAKTQAIAAANEVTTILSDVNTSLLSTEIKTLILTILTAAEYTSDQTENLASLAEAFGIL